MDAVNSNWPSKFPLDHEGAWILTESEPLLRRMPNLKQPYMALLYVNSKNGVSRAFYGGRWRFAVQLRPGSIVQFAVNRFVGDSDIPVRYTGIYLVLNGCRRVAALTWENAKILLRSYDLLSNAAWSLDSSLHPCTFAAPGVIVRPWEADLPAGWKRSIKRSGRRRSGCRPRLKRT